MTTPVMVYEVPLFHCPGCGMPVTTWREEDDYSYVYGRCDWGECRFVDQKLKIELKHHFVVTA